MNSVNFKSGETEKRGSCMFKSLVFAFLFVGMFFLFNLSLPVPVFAEDDVIVQDPGAMQDQGVIQDEVPSADDEALENETPPADDGALENETPPADDGDVQGGEDDMQDQENVQTDEE